MYFQTYTPQQPFIPNSQWAKKQYKAKTPKPKAAIHNPFTHKARSLKAQSLLEAILSLLQFEASRVGLAQEATLLTYDILKRNYLQRRS